MKLTVAIITYDRPELLARCLRSFLNQERMPDETIVIDSSPTPFPSDQLAMFSALNLQYVHIQKRTLIPIARNHALRLATGTHIVYIDDDAAAVPTFLRAIEEGYASDPIIGSVGGPMINAKKEGFPDRPLIRDAKKRVRVLPWGEIRSDIPRWVPPKPVYVDGLQGGSMSFSLDLLRSIGGFDEGYEQPSFREESDATMRVLRAGRTILYHPEAFVWHMPDQKGGITDFESHRADYFYRAGINQRRFADKYFNKLLSRASWILWSRTPPSLIIALGRTVVERQNYLAWHKGLWKNPRT